MAAFLFACCRCPWLVMDVVSLEGAIGKDRIKMHVLSSQSSSWQKSLGATGWPRIDS